MEIRIYGLLGIGVGCSRQTISCQKKLKKLRRALREKIIETEDFFEAGNHAVNRVDIRFMQEIIPDDFLGVTIEAVKGQAFNDQEIFMLRRIIKPIIMEFLAANFSKKLEGRGFNIKFSFPSQRFIE